MFATILSANENLLERLVLLVQNSLPSSAEETADMPQAYTVLLNSATNGLPISLPSPAPPDEEEERGENPHNFCTKWVALMAKKSFSEHSITLQALADLYRLSMVMSGGGTDNPVRILIVKKEHSDDDEPSFLEYLDTIKKDWVCEWGSSAEKLKRFGESDARCELLATSKCWSEPPSPTCALAYFDDPNLLRTIDSFLEFGGKEFQVKSLAEEGESEDARRQNFFTKPPTLHWTNYPRESEVQITFKFNFPKGTTPDWLFRGWTKMARNALAWDYEYEWTNGVLLRAEELIKITVTRSAESQNVIEVSGRIDTDEAAEDDDDEDDGIDADKSPSSNFPLQRVWPYLIRVFESVRNDVDRRKTLPYSMSFVFIGEIFFKSAEGAPKIMARSLDAVQTLSSIQRVQAVRFRVDQEHIYSMDLAQCFPNFFPTKLADFCADKFELPSPKKVSVTTSSSSPSEGERTTTSGAQTPTSVAPHEKQRVDRSPSCIPAIAMNDGKFPPSPSHSLHVERQMGGYKQVLNCPTHPMGGTPFRNRGRRVSFGVIHSIPDANTLSGRSTPGGAASSPLVLSGTSAARLTPDLPPDAVEDETERKLNGDASVVVENVVDEMLQKAIDEVLVTD